MGKKIIVKGADFSRNGFQWKMSGDLPIYNHALSIISGSDAYGSINMNDYPKRACTYTPVFIPLGTRMTIKGLKPGSGKGLRVDGCFYSSSAFGHDTVVGDLHGSGNMFMINADGSSDEVTIINTYGDYWFLFAFCKGDTRNDDVVSSNYSLTYEYIV